MSDLLSLLLGIPDPLDSSPLPPGTARDFYFPSHRAPVSAGTYRVRLRYEVRPEPGKVESTIHMLPEEEEPIAEVESEREEYTIYSEVFVLP